MIEFSKPLLTEDAPEPAILEQKAQEESHQRARQSLAGMQGARRAVEEAGLMPKPPMPAKKPDAPTVKTKQKEKAAPQTKKATVAAKAKPKPKARVKQAVKPKRAAGSKKASQPEPEKKPEPAPQIDKEKIARQEALSSALEAIHGQPDPEAFAALFEVFASAPAREIAGAATLISVAFLRTAAKRRAPLLKALQPALRDHRATKLAAQLLQKLGTVLVAKPPAPVAPPPPGG